MAGGKTMRLIFVLIFSITFLSSSAQSIRGRLLADGQPIGMANILIYAPNDSIRPLVFLVTDSIGQFQSTLPAPGTYTLKTALIGYKPITRVLNVNTDLNLGDLSLQLNTRTMQEITVTGKKKLIQKTTTGFVVASDAILTQAAGTATDLLANIPTILVDGEGAITIRGKAPTILVNGRNSNLTANLDRIPASAIERIEVINNPGARYDADGEGGIINIVLKKNTAAGTNGAFALGAGMGAKERLSSSFMLNHKAGAVNLGMNYDNRYARRTRDVNTQRETFDLDQGHFLDQQRNDNRTEQTHNLKLNADYAGKKDELSFEGIFGCENTRNYEPLYTRSYFNDRSFDYGNLRTSDENPFERNWEGNLNYNRKFANSRKTLSSNISYAFGNEEENTLINTAPIDEKGEVIGTDYIQRTRNKELTHLAQGRIDYGFPVSARATVETGYKGILRRVNADFLNAYEQNGQLIPDPLFSNVFDFREQIHAVYGTYKSSLGASKALKYELGLRLEQMNNKGESSNPDTTFRNAFFNFFPSLNMGYKLKDGSMVSFNLGRRINRPGLWQLNPFIDITDSLNRRGGNPNLKPELVNTVELGYSHDWRQVGVMAKAFYRGGTNTILPYTVLLPGGIAFTQPQNIGSSTTYGIESFVNASAGKWWSSTASLSLYNQSIEGDVNGEDINSSLFSWYVKWANTFNFFQSTRAQLLFNYQAPTALPQGRRIAVYNVDLGFQQKIMQGRARLGLTVTDVFNTLENGSTVVTPDFKSTRISKSDTRAVLLTFAMTFGSAFREKLMENKFSAE
jgi:outer membrane receptor protein involved in Fe transport